MSPQMIKLLGTVATLYGLGGALSVLLQARRMHVRGTSGDVSARFFAVYVGGFAIWLLYGLGIGDVPVIVVHAVGLLCGTVTLAVTLKLRRSGAAKTRTTSEDREFERPCRPPSRVPEHRFKGWRTRRARRFSAVLGGRRTMPAGATRPRFPAPTAAGHRYERSVPGALRSGPRWRATRRSGGGERDARELLLRQDG